MHNNSAFCGLAPLNDAALDESTPCILSPVHSVHEDEPECWTMIPQEAFVPEPSYKVVIPGSMPHEPPMVVNNKQAHRILI